MGASQVQQFTFEFQREGVPYRATITQSPATGLSCDMQKFVGGSWTKSVTRMREGIIGAFAMFQAMQQWTAQAEAAGQGAKTKGKHLTPADEEVPDASE